MREHRNRESSWAVYFFLLALVAFTFFVYPRAVAARSHQDNVLGLRIGMSREEAHRHLKKIGALEREERGRQEVWQLTREPRFASLLVGFDGEFRVRYVTALAREGGQRMRYSELAPIKEARAESAGGAYLRYTWEFKLAKKRPAYFLIAEGRDPEYLKSFSIKRKPDASAMAEQE